MPDTSPAVCVPRIATPRLLLRELRTGDFEDYAHNLVDPAATAELGGPKDRRNAWRMFSALAGSWMLHGAGWWGVELAATGKLVGAVGAFFRELAPDLEVGWTIYRPHWGQGFATEAASAALAQGLATLGRDRAIAHISATNHASIRVSEKIGMRYEADVPFENDVVGLYVAIR